MRAIKPDAQTTMAVHKATGIPVLKAQEFIMKSPADLIQRILDGHRVRFATYLSRLPEKLTSKILKASDEQDYHHYLHDPIEDDPVVGSTVRQVIEEVSQELVVLNASDRQWGLCYLIWQAAQERLLRDHSIVWYSPAQMNPGSCFD